jgi:Ca2+-binding RTX toxin-like protein
MLFRNYAYTLIIISSYGILMGIYSCTVLSLIGASEVQAVNILIGTTNTTIGTEEDDVVVGCSHLDPNCSQGTYLFGLEDDDSLQGSTADDWIFGDEGNDELTAADGNDKLFSGSGNDVLQSGFGGDFLFGDNGNDELYSGPGDDVLIGGKGTDYLDCSDGYDIVIDFNPIKGDTHADNCEAVLTHDPNDIRFICYGSTYTSLTNTTLSIDRMSGRNIIGLGSGVFGFTCNDLGQDTSISLSSISASSNHQSLSTDGYETLHREAS